MLSAISVTRKAKSPSRSVPAGIALFMGAQTLHDHWPSIARWVC